MNYNEHSQSEKRSEGEPLYSRSVKAGKRVYYLDVKRDRRGEYYISMTESKRIKDAGDAMHPVYEKHKIFLYREDLEKFAHAFGEVVKFTQANAPGQGRPIDYEADNHSENSGEIKFDVDFE